MVDGFKPSQRKVLFSCFKRKLKSDIKVAQLSGYVSEHSAYHHGEASLAMTIVNLAQDFVGRTTSTCSCRAGSSVLAYKAVRITRALVTSSLACTKCAARCSRSVTMRC